jgi:ribosome biogenesis GTPase A
VYDTPGIFPPQSITEPDVAAGLNTKTYNQALINDPTHKQNGITLYHECRTAGDYWGRFRAWKEKSLETSIMLVSAQ